MMMTKTIAMMIKFMTMMMMTTMMIVIKSFLFLEFY